MRAAHSSEASKQSLLRQSWQLNGQVFPNSMDAQLPSMACATQFSCESAHAAEATLVEPAEATLVEPAAANRNMHTTHAQPHKSERRAARASLVAWLLGVLVIGTGCYLTF